MQWSDSWEVLSRGYPWIGSALVFGAMVILVRVNTPKLVQDMISFVLVWFLSPWALYALLVGVSYAIGPVTIPSWIFSIFRLWIGIMIPISFYALYPLLKRDVGYRIREGEWPRERWGDYDQQRPVTRIKKGGL